MLEMKVATYSVWRERFMKKRMMLFAAGTLIFVSTAQNTFAEEETGGIRKIADMVYYTQLDGHIFVCSVKKFKEVFLPWICLLFLWKVRVR